MYYFTYQTKNLVNGKTYIGVHSTNKLSDGYIGGGIYRISDALRLSKSKTRYFPNAVVKYGYDNFKLEVLCYFDSYEEALEEEAFLVNIDWVKSKDNYNAIEGGQNCPALKSEVFVYNELGDFTGKFNSYAEAAIVTKTTSKNISKIITNNMSGSKLGFRFFKNYQSTKIAEYDFNYLHGVKNPKAVSIDMFNLNGEYLKSFGSPVIASQELNIPKSSITENLRGKNKRCRNYIFKYSINLPGE